MTVVFISYASSDYEPFVRNFVADLAQSDVKAWIDQEKIAPGSKSWEDVIRSAFKERQVDALVLVATPASAKSVFVSGELKLADAAQIPIYAVWARGDSWIDAIELEYNKTQYIDVRYTAYNDGLNRIVSVLNGTSEGPTLRRETVEVIETNSSDSYYPYKGLDAFTAADKDNFFGRDALTTELVARVHALRDSDPRFLAVIGASGAGKSSVVMAGLLTKLHDGWVIINQDPNTQEFNRLTPGTKPLRALRRALSPHLDKAASAIMDDLQHPRAEGLLYLAEDIARDDANRALLFIDLLTTAAEDADCPLVTVITMRADFYHHHMNYPALGRLFEAGSKSVLPMEIYELVDAVLKPAARAGVRFEAGLANQIVFALREDRRALAGALPLLQFTLERLYAERDGDLLTWDAYNTMGGVQGAIGTHAEAVFAQLDADAQNALDSVFLALVNVDERGTPTRKRAPLDEVRALSAPAARLVDEFIANRLIIAGQEGDEPAYAEVSHEALLRNWTRLTDWIATIADDLLLYNKVIRAAEEWHAAGQPDFLLWKHEQLKPVYAMRERLNLPFDDTLIAFTRPEADRLLEQFIADETEHRRLSIIDRWNEIGPDCAQQVLKTLESISYNSDFGPRIANSVYSMVQEFDIPTSEICGFLQHPSIEARRHAAYILYMRTDADSIQSLIVSLSDEDVVVRRTVARALWQMGRPEARQAFIDALHDHDENVRRDAAEALSSMKHADVNAVLPLSELLQDDSRAVRISATKALGTIGHQDAVTPLVAAMHDDAVDVRYRAAEALGKIGHPDAIPSLLEALQDTARDVRRNASYALGAINNSDSIPALVTALKDEDAVVREHAAYALGQIGSEAAVQPLINTLGDSDSRVRNNAADALGRLAHPSAISPLLSVIQDRSADVRSSVVEALGKIGDVTISESILPLMLDGTINQWESRVNDFAAQALARLGDSRGISHLAQALDHEAEDIRDFARAALEELDTPEARAALERWRNRQSPPGDGDE